MSTNLRLICVSERGYSVVVKPQIHVNQIPNFSPSLPRNNQKYLCLYIIPLILLYIVHVTCNAVYVRATKINQLSKNV